jgi:uncharacterized membrane protein
MLRTLALLIVTAGAAPADVAGPLPALHHVNTDRRDALILRAAPDRAADAVGTLTPYQWDVEVVAIDHRSYGSTWAQVALPEGGGWVAAHVLSPQGSTDGPDWLPPMLCTGTEPFWSFDLGPGEVAGLAMDGHDAAPVFVTRRTVSANDPRSHGLTARWDGPEGDPSTFGIAGAPVTGILRRAACSDGMSDRPYGVAVDLMLRMLGADGRTDVAHLSGCCRLAP